MASIEQQHGSKQGSIILGIAILLALINGLIYVFIVPPWQHYDEPNHFEYVWLVANHPGLPKPGDFDLSMRREVAESMIAHGFFNTLGFLPDLNSEKKPAWIGTYSQLDEPPLYYILASLPLRLSDNLDITSQLYEARLVSLFLYLLTVATAWLVMKEITPPSHPLRLVVPVSLALLPAFTDLMTAVNDDVAAVFVFSLFLLGSIRLICRGFSLRDFIFTTGVAFLAFWTKSSAYFALPLLLVVILVILLRGRWYAWVILFAGALVLVTASVSWGDAATWYRATSQPIKTRTNGAGAVLGRYAFQIDANYEVTPPWLFPLFQPVPSTVSDRLKGKEISLGVWMWASKPVEARMPILGNGQKNIFKKVSLSTSPQFFAVTSSLSRNYGRLWLVVMPFKKRVEKDVTVYYDGFVLAEGVRPVNEPPIFIDPGGEHGTWGNLPFDNLLRNGSAERGGPWVRPWIDNLGVRFMPDHSRPSWILSSLLDWPGSGWYYRTAFRHLGRTFWAKFGWAHVSLVGHKPYRALALVTFAGIIGAGVNLFRKRRNLNWNLVLFLGLVLILVWGAAIIRGSIYLTDLLLIPAARYAYPAIIPTMLLLNAGWLAFLVPLGHKVKKPPNLHYLVYFLAFVSLDAYALWSIFTYYK